FYSLVDWLCQGSRAVNAGLLEDSLDLLRSNQRPRGVVHRDVSCSCIQIFHASADGILTVFATRNDRPNLFEIFIANDRFDFSVRQFGVGCSALGVRCFLHCSCFCTSALSVLPSVRPATFACNAFITAPICAFDVAPTSEMVSRTTFASSSALIACGKYAFKIDNSSL